MMKKIAVLTSGGDAPGMNAAVAAVTKAALASGIEVLGVVRGYDGLLKKDVISLDLKTVSSIADQGGTVLYTARSPEYNTKEGVAKAAQNCREMGIDGVVVIGGDGSYRGARDLCGAGIPCIGIPGTIDNDISSTDYTIGYDTCLNTAMEIVDKVCDTSCSHDRCAVIEVMGRHAGYIALNVGIAVGASAALLPEIPFDFEKDVIQQILSAKAQGKNSFVVVVAEGIGGVDEIAKKIEAATGVESRANVLGHCQRGGRPTVRDRVMASQMGYYAVELLKAGKSNRVVAIRQDKIVDYDLNEGLAMKKSIDPELYHISRVLAE